MSSPPPVPPPASTPSPVLPAGPPVESKVGENIPPEGENAEKKSGKQTDAYLQKWLHRLQGDAKRFTTRNVILASCLALGAVLFFMLLGWIHQKTVGKYAVLKDIHISQNPCQQGQLEISFEVVSPGQVYCRRSWGDGYADICDDYFQPGHYTRPWSWTYQPGKPIDVTLWFRSGFFSRRQTASFPTANTLDMVFIIDTTGSMDESLKNLKEKCVEFSKKVANQSLFARFALIGFGDTQDGEWKDVYDFTTDIRAVQTNVAKVKRFDGGDLPESALDALVEALKLNYSKDAIRRFYLVTDESFHEKTADGKYDAAAVAKILRENGIVVDVFCRPSFREAYAPIYGTLGRYLEIENFGKVLSEGRVLED